MTHPKSVRKGQGNVVTYSEAAYGETVVRERYYLMKDQEECRAAWDEDMFTEQFNDPDADYRFEILNVESLLEWQVRQ
ncbi:MULTISPECIES: hypothetical protein [unclassified Streptomyces]|uniref:hypothetical protein n=1 Tax=Streptomyces sp. NPDC056835 TaxID=3345956 RepID=UPI0036AB2A80